MAGCSRKGAGVAFRWKDYRIDGPGRWKTMRLHRHEFHPALSAARAAHGLCPEQCAPPAPQTPRALRARPQYPHRSRRPTKQRLSSPRFPPYEAFNAALRTRRRACARAAIRNPSAQRTGGADVKLPLKTATLCVSCLPHPLGTSLGRVDLAGCDRRPSAGICRLPSFGRALSGRKME